MKGMKMTVDKKVCKYLKDTGKFHPRICELCRNRKTCKERVDHDK